MSAIDAGERFISNRFRPKSERSEPSIPSSPQREPIRMTSPEIMRSRNPKQYRPRFEHDEQPQQQKRPGLFSRGYGSAKSAYGTAKKAGETYYEIKRKYNAARQLFTDIQHERRNKKLMANQRALADANTATALKDIENVKYQEL